jgi:hypothetical protein
MTGPTPSGRLHPAVAPTPIAIVGMSAVMPEAPNAATFWDNITKGRYSITDVPPERWDPALYYDADPKRAGQDYSKIGGWVTRLRVGPDEVAAADPAAGQRADGRGTALVRGAAAARPCSTSAGRKSPSIPSVARSSSATRSVVRSTTPPTCVSSSPSSPRRELREAPSVRQPCPSRCASRSSRRRTRTSTC